jgi:hypothetical protein
MNLRNRLSLFVLGTSAAGLTIFACTGDSTNNPGPGLDAGDDAAVEDASADVSEPAMDAGSKPVADATVDVVEEPAPPLADAVAEATVDAPAEAAVDAGAACDDAGGQSHVHLTFDSNDPEYVSGVTWTDSTDASTANWSAAGGTGTCGDEQEFFGEAYGAPEGTTPLPVVSGHRATLQAACDGVTIVSGSVDCTDAGQLPVTTSYTLYGGAKINEVKITRSFGFGGDGGIYSGTGLRPYVARVPLAVFDSVIYPNQAGSAVTKIPATNCPGDCLMPAGADSGPDWGGTWFADIASTSGYAVVMVRDPSSTAPVDLTVNYDSFSSSNLASFVLLQPAAGWQGPISETEYLCFEDLTTWPQSQRDAAVLPAGCGP